LPASIENGFASIDNGLASIENGFASKLTLDSIAARHLKAAFASTSFGQA